VRPEGLQVSLAEELVLPTSEGEAWQLAICGPEEDQSPPMCGNAPNRGPCNPSCAAVASNYAERLSTERSEPRRKGLASIVARLAADTEARCAREGSTLGLLPRVYLAAGMPREAAEVAKKAVGLLRAACDAGRDEGCRALGDALASPPIEDEGGAAQAYRSAAALAEQACRAAPDDTSGCSAAAWALLRKGPSRDAARASALLREAAARADRACAGGGDGETCRAAGALFDLPEVGDKARALKAYRRRAEIYRAQCVSADSDFDQRVYCHLAYEAVLEGPARDPAAARTIRAKLVAILLAGCPGSAMSCLEAGEIHEKAGAFAEARAAYASYCSGTAPVLSTPQYVPHRSGWQALGCEKLARLHLEGKGAPKDRTEAARLLRLACSLSGDVFAPPCKQLRELEAAPAGR
jgi:hypothetical protein